MADGSSDVDAYIDACPAETRKVLTELRRRVLAVVPDAGEKISYRIPTVTMHGRSLVFFAAFEHHVGVYPVPTLDDELEPDVAPYRSGKATLRLRLAEPVPYELVVRVVERLVERAEARRKPKKASG